jgi:hypothetical protein
MKTFLKINSSVSVVNKEVPGRHATERTSGVFQRVGAGLAENEKDDTTLCVHTKIVLL